MRSLEAGMGCPDWPKCYDRWIPPTRADQLPTNYRTLYYEARKAQNLRLAKYMDAIGWEQLADAIRREAQVFRSEHFDPFKAWIEYLNRILGIWVGFLGLCFCALGWIAYSKSKGRQRACFRLSLATLLSIILSGLLGALVVATHLITFCSHTAYDDGFFDYSLLT